jgi:hypothetical protein
MSLSNFFDRKGQSCVMTMLVFDHDDSDDDDEDLLRICLFAGVPCRNPKYHRVRMDWNTHVRGLLTEGGFTRFYRMSYPSFQKLLNIIRPCLEIDEKKSIASTGQGPITPEIQLHIALRYIAGGSYDEIRLGTQMSVPSFYRIVWKVIDAINSAPELQIKLPTTKDEINFVKESFAQRSTGRVMEGCVGALDGWLCQIQTPAMKHTPNQLAYYSGHYKCSGVNVQAMCDGDSRFLYIGVICPGSANDVTAYRHSKLRRWIDNLPLGTFVLADNAYICTDTLLTPFFGDQRGVEKYSNFNFFLSQLRITIEQAFGMFVGKWRIFLRPLACSFTKIPALINCAACLHNFCIDERLTERPRILRLFCVNNPTEDDNVLGYFPTCTTPTPLYIPEGASMHFRSVMVAIVERSQLRRPQRNLVRNFHVLNKLPAVDENL